MTSFPLAGNAGSVPPPNDPAKLRDWWHQILREYGRYKCYAIFLALPADFQTVAYLQANAKEMHILSGDNCLIITFSGLGFVSFESDQKTWYHSLNDHITEGHSVGFAKILNIKFDEFPCLILFRDIRSPDYIKVNLKGLAVDEILQSTRSIFTVIQDAVSKREDPLAAVERHRNNQDLISNGKTIVSRIRQLTGRTLETVMKAYIEAYMKANVK